MSVPLTTPPIFNLHYYIFVSYFDYHIILICLIYSYCHYFFSSSLFLSLFHFFLVIIHVVNSDYPKFYNTRCHYIFIFIINYNPIVFHLSITIIFFHIFPDFFYLLFLYFIHAYCSHFLSSLLTFSIIINIVFSAVTVNHLWLTDGIAQTVTLTNSENIEWAPHYEPALCAAKV